MYTNIIEVFRMPMAPNAIYHRQCYTPDEQQENDVILGVLRLKDDAMCTKCAEVIKNGIVYEEDNKDNENNSKLIQMSLFSLEDVA